MPRNKTITLYALDFIAPGVDNVLPTRLTIARSKKEISEYAHVWLRNSLLDEYQEWAIKNNLDADNWSTWHAFFTLEIPSTVKSTLQISKIRFRLSEIAMIFRMFNFCEPLGCSFESKLEQTYYKTACEEENLINDK